MKNRYLAGTIIFFLFSAAGLVCPAVSAEGGRTFSMGLVAGGGPVGAAADPSLRAGIEMAFRFGGHWAASAGLSYGALTTGSSSTSGSYFAKEDVTWTVLPIYLTLRYEALISEAAILSFAAGEGYHSFRRIVESESNALGSTQVTRTESSLHAWAPQVEVGLEIYLSKAFSLTGAVRYEFGIASQESVVFNMKSVQEFSFGGISLLMGARLYLF
jgi:hypothetical protein